MQKVKPTAQLQSLNPKKYRYEDNIVFSIEDFRTLKKYVSIVFFILHTLQLRAQRTFRMVNTLLLRQLKTFLYLHIWF